MSKPVIQLSVSHLMWNTLLCESGICADIWRLGSDPVTPCKDPPNSVQQRLGSDDDKLETIVGCWGGAYGVLYDQ